MPDRCALASRWRITSLPSSRITVSHRDDRDAGPVVEYLRRYPHPFSKAVSARVVPRNSGFVHARSRSLTDDQNPRSFSGLNYRPWPKRKLRFAHSALAYSCKKMVESWCIAVEVRQIDHLAVISSDETFARSNIEAHSR